MTRDSRYGHRKRSRDEYSNDDSMSVGETLRMIKNETHDTIFQDSPPRDTQSSRNDNDDDAGQWEVAESHRSKKRKKMPKKDGGNYPSISHSSHSRLQSFVKLSDLQNLVLYLLADGTAPQ